MRSTRYSLVCQLACVAVMAATLVGGTVCARVACAEPSDATTSATTADNSAHKVALTTRQLRFADAGDKDPATLVWTTTNESVATVTSDGLIQARGVGMAEVVAKSADGALVSRTEVTVSAPTYAHDFDVMQDRWQRRIVGGTPYDQPLDASDTALIAYAQRQIATAPEVWASLHKEPGRTTLWDRIPSDSDSANYTSQLKKLRVLVIAFGTNVPGNKLYHNRALYQDIMGALDFFVNDMHYGTDKWVGNWWDWQIGCPGRLADILVVMSDFAEPSQIDPVVQAVGRYCQEPAKQLHAKKGWIESTGANRTDIALAMLGMGIVSHNAEPLRLIDEQVPAVMELVTKGDGIYADASLVQHTAQAYTGTYGNELLKGIGKITSLLADTQWAITDNRIANVYHVALEGFVPLTRNAAMMSAVNGRAVSRVQPDAPRSPELYWGSETIANMLLIARSAPQEERASLQSFIKGWLKSAGASYYDSARDFDALLLARSLEADTSVTAKDFRGMRVYGSMDRVVQQRDGYAATLAMHSSRVYNFECMNKENLHGWHTGDGMLYLYDAASGAQDMGFWPTIDPYRLPGTTVDTRPLADGAGTGKFSPASWVGGVTDGNVGAAGMQLDASGLGLGMDVKAKKSYFMLDGLIVELGADISGTTPATIETTVDQRMLTGGSETITAQGKPWDGSAQLAMAAGDWVSVQGRDGAGMGYLFLQPTKLTMDKTERSGTYAAINSIFPYAQNQTRTWLHLGINHGNEVEGATYAFALVPGATPESLSKLAQHSSIEVVANDAQTQVVRVASQGITAGNVWDEQGGVVGPATVDGTASVLIRERDGVRTVYVSDPTQKRDTLTIHMDGVVSTEWLGAGITDKGNGTYEIATAGTAGASHGFAVRMAHDEAPSEDDNHDQAPATPPTTEPTTPPTTSPSDAKAPARGTGKIPASGDASSYMACISAGAAGLGTLGLVARRTMRKWRDQS